MPGFIYQPQPEPELSAAEQTLESILEPSYWRRLLPELHCQEQQLFDQSAPAAEEAVISQLREELRIEGYYRSCQRLESAFCGDGEG